MAAAAGYDQNLVLCSDGTMAAWGRNDYGQVGDGTTTQRLSPTQVGTRTTWATLGTSHVAATCAAVRERAAALGGVITREPGPVKGGTVAEDVSALPFNALWNLRAASCGVVAPLR